MAPAQHEAGLHARASWPVAVFALSVIGGLVFAAGAVTSRGSDLRPAGGDVSTLLQDRTHRVQARRELAAGLRAEVDGLSRKGRNARLDKAIDRLQHLEHLTGMSAAVGPGLRVVLTDAPRSADEPGLDPNILVVHQQDIQAFVNALWSGGAEAISLQGQRLVSTTGIKCVGSTVVLDGVPYSPPYFIDAIGDPDKLQTALDSSPEVTIYRAYVQRYRLGLDVHSEKSLVVPAYGGSVGLRHAQVAG